jgi:hypothetical protein
MCVGGHGAHQALAAVARDDLSVTLVAATVHSTAMVLTGGTIAWIVYRYVGLGFLRRTWFNLDLLWAVLLIVVGAIALGAALWT